MNIVLAVLVFAAALTVPVRIGARLQRHGLRLLVVTVAGSAAMVVIAWAVSHLVAAGPLRLGVLAVGVAPVEIATLGVAPRGRGDPLASGVMLIGSTVLTALFAGPVMALLADGTSVRVGNLIVTLLVVVVAPFAVGLAIRTRVGAGIRARASTVAAVAVTVLVWLVASQAHLSDAYVGVVVALAILIVAGAGAGLVIGRAGRRPERAQHALRDVDARLRDRERDRGRRVRGRRRGAPRSLRDHGDALGHRTRRDPAAPDPESMKSISW